MFNAQNSNGGPRGRLRFESWLLRFAWFLFLIFLNFSCASATQSGTSTALSGVDLVNMTSDMAAKIGADAEVNAAYAKKGPLRVVVMPVVNNLRAEVIPRGAAYAFTGRVRVLLSQHAPERFTWIMNRDAFHDLRARESELQIDAGPNPDTVQPEYALTATFSSIGDENIKRREQFYVCVFELTNLQDRTLLWSGSYEIQKQTVRGFLN